MENGRLEHTNITVVSVDRAIEFLTTAFGHYAVRGGGETMHEGQKGRWLHLGADDTYIALQESEGVEVTPRNANTETGINHVGFVVDDVDGIMARMVAAGHKHSLVEELPSRRRLYVDDFDGITWEFVEYLSDDPAVRNDYSI